MFTHGIETNQIKLIMPENKSVSKCVRLNGFTEFRGRTYKVGGVEEAPFLSANNSNCLGLILDNQSISHNTSETFHIYLMHDFENKGSQAEYVFSS